MDQSPSAPSASGGQSSDPALSSDLPSKVFKSGQHLTGLAGLLDLPLTLVGSERGLAHVGFEKIQSLPFDGKLLDMGQIDPYTGPDVQASWYRSVANLQALRTATDGNEAEGALSDEILKLAKGAEVTFVPDEKNFSHTVETAVRKYTIGDPGVATMWSEWKVCLCPSERNESNAGLPLHPIANPDTQWTVPKKDAATTAQDASVPSSAYLSVAQKIGDHGVTFSRDFVWSLVPGTAHVQGLEEKCTADVTFFLGEPKENQLVDGKRRA